MLDKHYDRDQPGRFDLLTAVPRIVRCLVPLEEIELDIE